MNLVQKYIDWFNKSSFGKRRAAKLGRQATTADFWGDWKAFGYFFKQIGLGGGKVAGKGILGIILGFLLGAIFIGIPAILIGIFVVAPIALFFIVTIIGSIFGIPLLLFAAVLVIFGIVFPFFTAFGGGIGAVFNKFTMK